LIEAIEKYPNDPALYFSLAEIYHSKGQISNAVKLLKRANELELNNPATKEFINNINF
jgi:tetratricopeptide (TPR) repeat protein